MNLLHVGPSLLIRLSKSSKWLTNKPNLKEKFQILKNSKWLRENHKGLQNVLAKIEGLDIF
jgi:hypothetical protein